MERIDIGGRSLRVSLVGEGAPAFVCLHGLADSLAIWEKLAPGLTERGRVVLVDQRAHGQSGAPPGPYRREELAADVAALLDRLDLPSAVLVGHSMGGIVAMTTAIAYPERVAGLVLLGTASQATQAVTEWFEKIACATEEKGIDGLRAAIFGAKSTRRIAGDAQGMAHVTRCLKSLYEDPLTPRLVEIRCPTLVMVGDKDPMGPGASVLIHRQLADAELQVIPGRGHWLQVECPGDVLAAIDRFLVPRLRRD